MSAPDLAAIDVATIARAQGGDRQALDRVLRALQAPLFQHVALIVRDDALAADVLQRVLLQVARRLGALRDPRWLRAWAYRIATREAVRLARRERAWRDSLVGDSLDELPEVGATTIPFDEEAPVDPELVARLPALLDALSPGARVVLRLHYLDGLTIPEVAEALEIPRGTAKSRLAYGLAALRTRLGARES